MLERNDQRLLWKSVDGFTTAEEERYLKERLKNDEQLRKELRYIQILDSNLFEIEKVAMPGALKEKILARTTKFSKIQILQTPGFYKRGMMSFAAFNLAILVLGLLIYTYYSGWSNINPQSSILSDFYRIIEMSLVRSLFLVCISVLGLLLVDHFLKNRNYGKTTTPV